MGRIEPANDSWERQSDLPVARRRAEGQQFSALERLVLEIAARLGAGCARPACRVRQAIADLVPIAAIGVLLPRETFVSSASVPCSVP